MNKYKDFFKNRTVLVTGATGFIGTNLIRRLLDHEANLRAVVYKKEPKIKYDQVDYVNADLTNKNDCLKVTKDVDFVFMCSANSSGAAVIEKEPLTHLTPNVIMNALMLEASYFNDVKKFIFISSNTVYPVTNFPVTEEDVDYTFFDKYHIVGWMKLFSEEMCKMYSQKISKPMKTLIVRPGNIYGQYDKFNKKESKVIAAIVRRFAENENPLTVWGDGNDLKDFIFIDDFVHGLIDAAISNIEGPINICSGESITIKDVISELKSISGKDHLTVNYDSSKPSMIPVRLMSNSYVKKELNFEAKTSLREGLKKTYDWYKIFYSNKKPEDLE